VQFLLLAAAFLATQALLAALLPRVLSMGNVRWWTWLAELMREHGFLHVWTPYPPLFPALFRLAHRLLAAGMPHGEAVARMTAAWMVFNYILLLACTALVHAICRERLRAGQDARRAWLGAAAFLLVSSSWRSGVLVGWRMDQFDYLPLAFLLGGLLALMRGRPVAAAALAALGTASKLFPAVLLPLVLLRARGKRRWACGLAFAAVCTAACAPGMLADRDIFLATWRWSGDRPAWETPFRYPWQPFFAEPLDPPRAALLRWCAYALPPMHGSKEQMAALFTVPYRGPGERLGELDRARRPSALVRTGLPLLTLLAAAAYLGLWRRRLRQPCSLPEATLVLLLLLLVFSRGVSSYFVVWLMPLLCVLLPGLRGFALCAALLILGNVELAALGRAAALALSDPAASQRANTLFWAAIFLRHGLLALLALCLAIRPPGAAGPGGTR
jgi:hypothetical protein